MDAEIGTPGRFELAAGRFQDLLRGVIRQAINAAGVAPAAIQAVSYSSQANSFLLLDGEGAPLSPIILWQDRRVGEVPAELVSLRGRADFLSTTGMDTVSPLGCASKLLWLREREADTWRATRMVMTMSDFLTRLMTGERAGSSGTASLLGLWNLPVEWWQAALDACVSTRVFLSRLFPPGTVVGRTSGSATELFGVPKGIPFAVGSLDHHMAALAAGSGPRLPCWSPREPFLPALPSRAVQPPPALRNGAGGGRRGAVLLPGLS